MSNEKTYNRAVFLVDSLYYSIALDNTDNYMLKREGKRRLNNELKKRISLSMTLQHGINYGRNDIKIIRYE